MPIQNLEYYTLGEIADELSESLPRIQYICSKHRIKPVARVGLTRLFTQEQKNLINEYLQNVVIYRNQF